jgi:hypothetical protein
MADIFSLTDEQLRQIRQWERDKEALEQDIAERQAKLADISEKLKAVAVLRARLPEIPQQEDQHPVKGNGSAEAGNPNLTAAIERIAITSSAPLTKRQLKERLRAEHFSEDRLGAYFYTVVMRLKEKQRIRVLEDGKVWRP